MPLLTATRDLAARYEAVLVTHPDLAGRLGPLHATHVGHVAALLDLIGRDSAATPPPGAAGAATGPTGGPPGAPAGDAGDGGDAAVPADPDEAVAALREAEQEAHDDATEASLAAPPDRAALLGSITAARATHGWVLT